MVKSVALPLHLGEVVIEKAAFESPSTTVANNIILQSFYLFLKSIYKFY